MQQLIITFIHQNIAHKQAIAPDLLEHGLAYLRDQGLQVQPLVWLDAPYAADVVVQSAAPLLRQQRRDLAHALAALCGCDVAVQPPEERTRTMLICDMDSTLIQQECIDEMAEMLGIKPQIADITERAMQGELEFIPALQERVGLLAGLALDALEEVWRQRIQLTPGARVLVQTMRARGAHTVLVSGGFTFFSEKVSHALGMHAHAANKLEIIDNTLSGQVLPPILDKHAKVEHLQQHAATLGIDRASVMAVGDGANDLPMLAEAGFGVGYYAKPVVASQCDCAIAVSDLSALLYIQGIAKHAWVE